MPPAAEKSQVLKATEACICLSAAPHGAPPRVSAQRLTLPPRLLPYASKAYIPPDPGPYPEDQPRQNTVRFTPVQAQAVLSGLQPGLTMLVGPPGESRISTFQGLDTRGLLKLLRRGAASIAH